MSHYTDYTTDTEMREEAWVEAALKALAPMGLTFVKDRMKDEFRISYKPIEGYRGAGNNLRIYRLRQTDRYIIQGDDYKCEKAMADILLRIEDGYNVEAHRAFMESEGFSFDVQGTVAAPEQEVILCGVRY
jgi:hypothetical protein